MNNAKYSEKFEVFVANPKELVQISNMDIIILKRKIANYAVFKIMFGWTADNNPLYKIKKETIEHNKMKSSVRPA